MKTTNLKNIIDDYLNHYFDNRGSYNKLIFDAASYSLNVGGKRIRPILMLLTYEMYGKDINDILIMAAALEMIHTYSLIHDDLPCMDNDDLRRGMPTSHKKFGEDIAVLAGDTLLNEAMTMMLQYACEHSSIATKVALEISKAAGPDGMIGGQVVDVINEGKKISSDELSFMHENKTGQLIRVSAISGAMLAEAPTKDIEILNEFGKKLGLAFQVKDDILDIEGIVEILGKNTFSDEQNNKTNFITLYGLEKCKEICFNLTQECLDLLKQLSVNTDKLIEITNMLLQRES